MPDGLMKKKFLAALVIVVAPAMASAGVPPTSLLPPTRNVPSMKETAPPVTLVMTFSQFWVKLKYAVSPEPILNWLKL